MTAFEGIYRDYFKDVFLFLKALAKDEALAEELTAETFFKAMSALDSFDGRCDVRVWLCQIAKNSFYTHQTKSRRFFAGETSDETITQIPDETRFEEELADRETSLRIHRELHKLDEPYKEVFSLRVFGELSFKQIGDVFNKTDNWACVTYHRAKAKIQKGLNDDDV